MLLAYPPGAANDSNARAVAAKLTDIFKQQVIVDNRPGASGIVASTVLARAAVTRFNTEINNVLTNPEVKERMTQAGNELTGGTPQPAAEFIRAEVARWKKIIKPEMRLSR
jgi:tripartite-type tricarboxylate transporter receptor subunit TctC